MTIQLKLNLMRGLYGITQMDPNQPVPRWAMIGSFYSVTKTNDELSIVCTEENVPLDVTCERSWRIFKLEGPFAFTEVGILKTVTSVLSNQSIGVFAISTFDTDYVLVKQKDFNHAMDALRYAGHKVTIEP